MTVTTHVSNISLFTERFVPISSCSVHHGVPRAEGRSVGEPALKGKSKIAMSANLTTSDARSSTPSVSCGASRSATPTSDSAGQSPARTYDSLTTQVAFRASEAVARALIDLDLPGPLADATALLRSLAEEHDEEHEEDHPPIFSGVGDGEDEELSPVLGSVASAGASSYEKFSATSGTGSQESSVEPSRREASQREEESTRSEEPSRYTPYGGDENLAGRTSPAAQGASTPLPVQIDWAAVRTEVRATVFKVYAQIQMVADSLEDANSMHAAAPSGSSDGPGSEAPDAAEAHRDDPLSAARKAEPAASATPSWLRQATDKLAHEGTPPLPPLAPAFDDASPLDGSHDDVEDTSFETPARHSSSSGVTLSSDLSSGDESSSEAEAGSDADTAAGSSSMVSAAAVPRTPEPLLHRAATRWALENAVLLGAPQRSRRLGHALQTWARHCRQLDEWLLMLALSPDTSQAELVSTAQANAQAKAQPKAPANGAPLLRGGSVTGRLSQILSAGLSSGVNAPSTAAGGSAHSMPAPGESPIQWRNAPVIPGLPSMDRVWRALTSMRGGGAADGGVAVPFGVPAARATADDARASAKQPPPAACATAAAIPGAPAMHTVVNPASQEAASVGSEDVGDAVPTPIRPAVTSTRAPRPKTPPSAMLPSERPSPDRTVQIVACAAGPTCVRLMLSFRSP